MDSRDHKCDECDRNVDVEYGAPSDRTDQTAYVGGGVRYYLTRRFFVRGEYKAHEIFTKRNANQQVDEWKLGFAFFF